jgi:hypothetical protein
MRKRKNSKDIKISMGEDIDSLPTVSSLDAEFQKEFNDFHKKNSDNNNSDSPKD